LEEKKGEKGSDHDLVGGKGHGKGSRGREGVQFQKSRRRVKCRRRRARLTKKGKKIEKEGMSLRGHA